MEAITRFYPRAVKVSDFISRCYRLLREGYSLEPRKVLVAQSNCSDDINSIQYPQGVRQTLGPFNLGGLGGYPFCGLTGMNAFAHHVPSDGAAVIYYDPHIGIGKTGTPGTILRVGQAHHTFCCGAVIKALLSVTTGNRLPENPLDYQELLLERLLLRSADRIQNAANELIEAVDVIYEAIGASIDQLIAETHFTGKYLFVFGGITVNGDLDAESYIEPRRFDVHNLQTREKTSELPFLLAL